MPSVAQTHLNINTLSIARIFPPSHPNSSPSIPPRAQTVPLSILDNTVGLYSPTSALWLYSFPSQTKESPENLTRALSESLIMTLAAYPQWAGKLHLTAYDPSAEDHTRRYGRMALTYGSHTDPGIALHIARCECTINSLIPGAEDKARGWWNAQPTCYEELLPKRGRGNPGRLALWDMSESDGLPCVLVQLTTFACGGVGIALRIAHPLADANVLVTFVRNWAGVHRGGMVVEKPVFDPGMLDRTAAGNIDGLKANEELVETSRALPISRYDYWQSGVTKPSELDSLTAEELDVGRGTEMPWGTWDRNAHVDHFIIYFTPAELQGMWEEASKDATARTWVSRFDALLAHVWALVIRARQLRAGATNMMHVTLGVRTRIYPALPSTFLGSPILLTGVPGIPESNISTLASSIRVSLAQFTPSAVSAHLHDKAFEVSPQRLWAAFLGDNNTIMTSWLDIGATKIDFFGDAGRLVFMDSLMSDYDGIVKFIEAVGGEGKRKKWYEGDVGVTLHLRTDAMELLLKDDLLRKYRT